jgi:hypothetical protein
LQAATVWAACGLPASAGTVIPEPPVELHAGPPAGRPGLLPRFAGLQKLANPRFLDAADPASIQAQLDGAAGAARSTR